MTFIGLSWHQKSQQILACTVDSVIDGAAKYIRQNGALSFEDTLPESCRKLEEKVDTLESFNNAIKDIFKSCTISKANRLAKINDSYPVITLFTTWTPDVSKDRLHTLTLQNWANLSPKIQVVVFTNSSDDKKLAKLFGAKTLPILRHGGGGAPVLKWMFQTVMKKYNTSKLFGYVNADIMFTNKLTHTLEGILNIKDMSKPIFLVGRRVNVDVNILLNATDLFSNLEKISKENGVLFGANAEDYFITNAAFPWEEIVDVVIGRLAYDNWIVGHVICGMNIDVIDLTETVLAVHQTTKKGGNYEGFKNKHAHYNNALFKKLKIIPIFDTGFTICSQELTKYNLCDDIQVIKRETFWEKCKCPSKVLF